MNSKLFRIDIKFTQTYESVIYATVPADTQPDEINLALSTLTGEFWVRADANSCRDLSVEDADADDQPQIDLCDEIEQQREYEASITR